VNGGHRATLGRLLALCSLGTAPFDGQR
jgi:hypothetical protein